MNAPTKLHALPKAGFAPGIYFNLPENEYRADPSLSASGIKSLIRSPFDYWCDCLDPTREDDQTEAKDKGKAYHKMLLEGIAAFDATYVVAPTIENYPDALPDGSALKAWLKDQGAKQTGTNAELYQLALEINPALEFWPDIRAKWKADHMDCEAVSRETWTELQRARMVLSRMDSAKRAFTGGMSEVSIFWVHESGVPMKARIDYLKPSAIVDLKTFANKMGKDLRSAVVSEISNNRYEIQAAVYLDGIKTIKALFKAGKLAIVGDHDPEWLEKVMATDRHRFFFAFLQTGRCPNFIIREFAEFDTFAGLGAQANEYFSIGRMAYKHGIEQWARYMRTFGPDEPWVTDYEIQPFRDDEFPVWVLQRGVQ